MLTLDVGIGNESGTVRNWFRFKGTVIGIDISKLHWPDVVCDAQNLPFKQSIFDKVGMAEVLEHLPNPIRALKEMLRVLKPKGILHITIPNGAWMPIFVNVMRNKLCSLHPEHVNYWNYEQLTVVLNIAGFKVTHHSYFTRYIQHGFLPKLSHLLRHLHPPIMEMNIMLTAQRR